MKKRLIQATLGNVTLCFDRKSLNALANYNGLFSTTITASISLFMLDGFCWCSLLS
jgi:hypothetical protein